MNTSLDRGADELTQALNHYVGDIVEGEFRTMYDLTLKNTHHKQSISKLSLFENRYLISRKENIDVHREHGYKIDPQMLLCYRASASEMPNFLTNHIAVSCHWRNVSN